MKHCTSENKNDIHKLSKSGDGLTYLASIFQPHNATTMGRFKTKQ